MRTAANENNNCVTLVQITDSHLYQQADGRLLAVPTLASLQAVVDLVRREQPDASLVLGTGDISQDGSIASYQHYLQQIERLRLPLRWMAGNHDVQDMLEQSSAGSQILQPFYDFARWRIILLDTSVDGAVFGHLEQQQLQQFEQLLQQAADRHVLVCLHHHPVDIGSAWIDRLGLQNADEFWAVVERYPSIRAVLCGHVHQDFAGQHQGVKVYASPSTCVQFLPQSQDFALDSRSPGYRWLRLHDCGKLETGVSRVAAGMFPADQDARGY